MAHAMQIRRTVAHEAVDVGELGSGQVRLRRAAAAHSYIDRYHHAGYYQRPLPLISSLEGAETVEAVAPDVHGLKVGDRMAYTGPHQDRSFCAQGSADAHRALEARATLGSTILSIEPSIDRSLP